MSTDFIVKAKARSDEGKGASRRLRRLEASVPAIVYGAGKEAQSITLVTKDFIRQLEEEAFFSNILTLEVDGKAEKVVIKDVQRHPVSTFPIHADFQRIDPTHKITVKVPVHFINEDKCDGVKNGGGTINHQATELEVSCLAKDLPEFIEVDVANLAVGQSVHVSEITLPAGVESVELSHGEDHDIALVSVLAPKGGAAEEEAEEAAE
ncbi:MAG: 50S ribosomal protein L25/general stress protein Ctc [Pseudomonadota bacterium]|nr:50S ribosomal protein L25/general stress protein Ctc [Pseudomonadota bacterium]